MIIHPEQYFGKWISHKDVTLEIIDNAKALCIAVNRLIASMEMTGFVFKINPLTGTIIGGESLGGFRPQDCPIGAPKSAHKQGQAVDIYDPDNAIDNWLTGHQALLKDYGLYFEHPTATPRWSHWSTRKPKSGRTFFYP
jgi:hypothetical protein